MIQTTEQLNQYMKNREQFGIKPGLERVTSLLEAVGNPESQIQAVHVAGTNGKGSVIQFMQTALVENDYRVGVFTSPSFIGLRGHFLINGHPVEETKIISMINQIIPAINELDQKGDEPTPFEIITVLAFIYFHKTVDIALIETGMGGRFDTTNCFHPIVSIITNIAKDHMQFLGSSEAEIAYQKAGIIKHNSPIVAGKLRLEAERVIKKEAEEKQATLYQLDKDFFQTKQIYNSLALNIYPTALNPGLKGTHQVDNAAVAFTALKIIENAGFRMNRGLVLEGFTQTTLPGRFEQISSAPVIILDSAHNPAGIESFVKTVEQTDESTSKQLLFAGFKDKQLSEMMEVLADYFDILTLTTFSHERAASVFDLKPLLHDDHINISHHWQEEVDRMLADTTNRTHYYITGSLHFITLVRSYIMKKFR